jgi:hypothetical protein
VECIIIAGKPQLLFCSRIDVIAVCECSASRIKGFPIEFEMCCQGVLVVIAY